MSRPDLPPPHCTTPASADGRLPARPTLVAAGSGRELDAGDLQRFVRVTGTRDDRFVEFEFSIGDPELAVELILPFDQFREFCERNAVSHLSPEEGARLDFERMKWRFGAPGIDQ